MRTFLVFLCLVGWTVSAAAQNPLTKPPKPPPRRGMSKAQVLARYGEPRHHAVLDGAEVWYYRVKFNEVYGRAFVPFEFSSENVVLGKIFFNPAGKIARFDWTQ